MKRSVEFDHRHPSSVPDVITDLVDFGWRLTASTIRSAAWVVRLVTRVSPSRSVRVPETVHPRSAIV
ncbi:hypothetical protein GCM10025875_15590 [Litorihabitans aurantiacus]|uniref:Uncharacterized protein n=1 Tax=Litorihabitans aurantiacus TaxID=1930061 RepID=A0AA37XE75_9MICO|nr:hypothetical protein GCM10025875_15590 [Litorihabitans aurantiacus]